jgi:hypothetical protein
MRKSIVVVSLFTSVICADAIEKNFVDDVAKTTLMGSQKSFESGAHNLQDNEKMNSFFVAFRYNFESNSDVNIYLNGAFGLAKFENNEPMLGVLGDRSVVENKNLELGGGVRYKINSESYLAVGGGVIYSQTNAKYESNTLTSLANQTLIEQLYNTNEAYNSYTYQANMKYDYETKVKGYEPYFSAALGYYYTNIQDLDETSSSVLGHMKAGIYSPELIKVFDLPFKVELYAQETFLLGDVKESMDMTNFTQVGMAFHLYTNTLVKYVDNVYFDVNYVTGENIEGLHIGLSASF